MKPPEKTIVVLPFVNMSSNEEMEYFSDGITEEIINALAKIGHLKVTSRTSSFFFKNKNVPVKEIANQLQVANVLEGSVRVAANTIRVTAQLIHAEEDYHFWSETWDRKLENIFEIQDEISLHIAEKLRENYGHFEIEDHLVENRTTNIDAYEYFLKARHHFNKWNPVDAQKAIELYEKAIFIDPNHIDSYVGLADAYSFFAVTELSPREEAWEKSKKYTKKAYLLNSENSGVHYLLANISFFYDANFQESFKHALRSVELKSNYPEAQQFVSFLYMISGEMDEAKKHLEIAHSIDPLSQETLFYRAYFLYRTEKYSKALKLADELLEKNPHNIPAFVIRSYCLLKTGAIDKAIQFLEEMPKEILVEDEQLGTLCLAQTLKGNKIEAEKYFNRLIEKARSPIAFQAHSYLYLTYVNMGKNDEAFAWLDEAIKLKSSVLFLTFADPLAENIKNDNRFEAYKKKLYLLPERPEQINEKPSLLDSESADLYSEKLLRFLQEEEPFLIPNITLRELAEKVDIHPNKLSWLLNERIGKNFNEFINYYRVEYFKKLVLDPENSNISFIGLAYESGFNSKTVFNTYFKKETGLTPKQYLKKNGSVL